MLFIDYFLCSINPLRRGKFVLFTLISQGPDPCLAHDNEYLLDEFVVLIEEY